MQILKNTLFMFVLCIIVALTGKISAQEVEIKKDTIFNEIPAGEAEVQGEPEEVEVTDKDISELPELILTAAQSAIEGITVTGFRKETELNQLVYEVEGMVGGMCVEIEITENGQVLEIEDCD